MKTMRNTKHSPFLNIFISLVAFLIMGIFSMSFTNQSSISNCAITKDTIPGPYPMKISDVSNNVTIHAHSINFISKTEHDPPDLSKVLLIVNNEKTELAALQQNDLYGDVITIYPANSAYMIGQYGDAASNGLVTVTQAFYEPKNIALYPDRSDTSTDRTFTKCEFPPSFPGGEGAWSSYIHKHLSDNLNALVGIKSNGTCRVRFIVDCLGNVSNVEALTMRGSKLAEIIVDAVKNGPAWLPGRQNGHLVRAYAEQPVTFKVGD